MARKHLIDKIIECDKDLTVLTSHRVLFERIDDRTFRVTSHLKLHKSEVAKFVERIIWRNFGKPKWVRGLCSSPSGYIYDVNHKPCEYIWR